MSSDVQTKNWDRLPVFEILLHLPAKALAKFRRVCKLWHAIINSPYFITKHFEMNYSNYSCCFDRLIILPDKVTSPKFIGFELMVDVEYANLYSSKKFRTPLDYCATYLYGRSQENTYLYGPCNGIYYLHSEGGQCPKRSVWNPALGQLIELPNEFPKSNLPSYMDFGSDEVHGFGFDLKTKDYKVIAIKGPWYYSKDDKFLPVYIYSLRTGCWRYWGNIKNVCSLEKNKCNVLANGCYYWLATSRYPYNRPYYESIISFNITTEEFHEILLPKFAMKDRYSSPVRQLVVLHNSIGFINSCEGRRKFSSWVWNEGDWTRKLYMSVGFSVDEATFSHWRDNLLVIVGDGKIGLCEINTNEVRVFDSPDWGGSIQNICAYKHSLVSIKELNKTNIHHEEDL